MKQKKNTYKKKRNIKSVCTIQKKFIVKESSLLIRIVPVDVVEILIFKFNYNNKNCQHDGLRRKFEVKYLDHIFTLSLGMK